MSAFFRLSHRLGKNYVIWNLGWDKFSHPSFLHKDHLNGASNDFKKCPMPALANENQIPFAIAISLTLALRSWSEAFDFMIDASMSIKEKRLFSDQPRIFTPYCTFNQLESSLTERCMPSTPSPATPSVLVMLARFQGSCCFMPVPPNFTPESLLPQPQEFKYHFNCNEGDDGPFQKQAVLLA